MDTQPQGEPSVDSLLVGEVPAEQARPQLEQLRAARLAGRVAQDAYLQRADYLATVAVGGKAEAPTFATTMVDRLEAIVAESMEPGQPHEFQLPRDPQNPLKVLEGESLELDTEVRDALASLKVPVLLGGPLIERVEHVIRELGPLSAEDREIRVESFRNALRARWGADYEKRRDAVADYVARAVDQHETVAGILDEAPWVLCDVATMDWLWSIVQFYAGRQ